jgi:hypothetical protein
MTNLEQTSPLKEALKQAQCALEASRQLGSKQRARLVRELDVMSHLVAMEARYAAAAQSPQFE